MQSERLSSVGCNASRTTDGNSGDIHNSELVTTNFFEYLLQLIIVLEKQRSFDLH